MHRRVRKSMRAIGFGLTLGIIAIAIGTGVVESVDTRTVDVRVTARSVEGDRIEFAIQHRLPDGSWSERLYGARRFFGPAQRDGRWKVATPVQVEVPLVSLTEVPTVTATPNSDNRITIPLDYSSMNIWHNTRPSSGIQNKYVWSRRKPDRIKEAFEGAYDMTNNTLSVSLDNVKAIVLHSHFASKGSQWFYLSPTLQEAMGDATDPNDICSKDNPYRSLVIECEDGYTLDEGALRYWYGVPSHLEMNLPLQIIPEQGYRKPYASERNDCEDDAEVTWKLNDTEVTQTQPNVNPYSYSRRFNINSNSNVALLVDGTNTISATYCRVKYREWRGRKLAESFETITRSTTFRLDFELLGWDE